MTFLNCPYYDISKLLWQEFLSYWHIIKGMLRCFIKTQYYGISIHIWIFTRNKCHIHTIFGTFCFVEKPQEKATPTIFLDLSDLYYLVYRYLYDDAFCSRNWDYLVGSLCLWGSSFCTHLDVSLWFSLYQTRSKPVKKIFDSSGLFIILFIFDY